MQGSKGHILITGSHRSGTTWVGKTIALHPRVEYVHEPFHAGNPNRSVGLQPRHWYEYVPESPDEKEIRHAFDSFFGASAFGRAERVCKTAGLDARTPLRFGKHLVLGSYRNRMLLKDPLALLSAGWMHERYGLDVVCMIRHPFSFVGSLKKAGWTFDFRNLYDQQALMRDMLSPFEEEIRDASERHGDEIRRSALLWNVLHYVILGYRKRYPSWTFMRYEDLAGDPVPGFRDLYARLGLRMGARIEASIESHTSGENPAESETTEYRPMDARKGLENWRSRLSPEEVETVRRETRELAARFYGDTA